MFKRAGLLACLLLVCPAAYAEQAPQQRLEQIQRQIDESTRKQQELGTQAKNLDGELDSLRLKLIAATTASDKSAEALQELEKNLYDLEGASARQSVQLRQQREKLASLLAVLQRLSLTPPAIQLLSDTPPIDRVRTDLQLKAILPDIQARAAELSSTVNDLRALKARLTSQRSKVVSERNQWKNQSRELDKLIAERNQRLEAARSQRSRELQRANQLANQAQNLRELMDRLQAEAEAEAQNNNAPDEKLQALPAGASRRLPVSAPALTRFGERDSFGNLNKGLILRPRAGAPVAAVASGRVAFAGPFRGYGRILILTHPGGYHTLTAGLSDVQVSVGDTVAAGEPLGHLPDATDPPPELYFEVRLRGTPIDPLGSQAQKLTQAR